MGAHGISVANASMMRSAVIVAVFAFALAVTAQEDTEAVVPEMDELATGSALAQAGKTTVQTHYETEEVPQKEVVEKPVYENVTVPVEEVHYKEVTKTIPVQKKVEVKEVVETTHTGCDLVVESCFATPGEEEVPAWKAPVIKYQHSYSNLCATESAAKRAAALKEKAAEKKTKEAASKGISAEKTSKKLEKALKEAQVKCSEKNKKAEIVAKETSRKSAEKEEKLFKSERDSKESASKAISMMSTHERIVYVPSAAPAIEVAGPAVEEDCATNPEQVKCLPKPSPAPAPLAPAKKFVCDSKKCQCVESTNAEGDDFSYCTEMCQTGPGCAPVPPPPVVTPAPALPPILSPAPEVYPDQQPAVPAAMPVYNDEGAMKSQFKLKESMMKTREKSAKSMTESKTKQSEQEMKVSATELKQKGSESAAKEKANKHQYHMENFYKSRARPYPVMPMVEQPESRPLEKGIKNVRRMKERFSKAKIEGVNAIKEAWSKHGHAKKKTNHCKETHEVCGKIHAASAARQVQAAQAADAHTASLETNCAKTVAFAKEAAEELTYHVCAAAAAKMDGLIKTIQNDFEYTNVTIPTISWGATFASAYGGEAAVEQQSMEKQQAQAMEAAKYYKK